MLNLFQHPVIKEILKQVQDDRLVNDNFSKNKQSGQLISNLVSSLLVILFLFLPFSSWIVSLTGKPSISLARDGLVLLIFVFSLFPILKKSIGGKKNILLVSAAVLLIYGLCSYFWREASALQWLRGYRFLFTPLILFISLVSINIDEKQKRIIYLTVLISGFIIFILSILELSGIRMPLVTSFSSGGSIEQIHYVSGEGSKRIQAVLAGPNALALYMLALSAYALGVFKNISRKLNYSLILFALILILTFSRSALLGLIVLILSSGFIFAKKKFGLEKALAWSASFLLLIFIMGFLLYQNPKYQNIITHYDSGSIRVEQYKRVWNSRNEIGFLGRGMGTAGLSSVNRLDGGPNHFTENVYLDIFEELGYFGLLLYLIFIISLIGRFGRGLNTEEGNTAFLIMLSFLISGIFINYYTGQAGVYLMWLAAGLALANKRGKNEKNIR